MTFLKRLRIPPLLALALWAPLSWGQAAPANSTMGGALMYELLLAEMSAQNGDAGTAFQLMLNAAQKNRSEQLFQRAVEIALRSRAGDSALQAAQAWVRVLPSSKEGYRYLVQILIGLNKLPETVEPLRKQLAGLSGAERSRAIAQMPRYFARVADKKTAVQVIERALLPETLTPRYGPAAFAAMGAMRLFAEDRDGALEAASKGLAMSPRAEEPAQLALALMDPQWPAPEAVFMRHLSGGTSADIRLAYVRKLLEAERYADAGKQIDILIQTEPNLAEPWLIQGSLALQEKKLEPARAALLNFVRLRTAEPVARAEPDKALSQAYFMLADLADLQKQPEEAQRYLSLVDHPEEVLRAYLRRATLLARQGKIEEARALIRSAPEQQPDDARTKVSAEVQILRDAKQHRAAYELLLQVVQSNATDVDNLYDLAMAAEKLERFEEMESLLRQVITLKPDYHHAYNALGYTLADRRERLPEARALVQKALSFAPNDPFILDSLGWVEFRSGNLALSAQILRDAFQNRPDAEIAAHLGEVLWALQEPEQARAIWKRGLIQNPDNETLNETIQRLSPP